MATAPLPAPAEERPAAVGAATALLDAYRPGTDRFFASPEETLLARGVRAAVPYDERPLPQRVAGALRDADGAVDGRPVVVGAVPFAPDAPDVLAVPESVRRGPALRTDPLVALPAPEPAPANWRIRPVPEPERYGAAVAEAVRRIRGGAFGKVVLARTLELEGDREPDVPAMVRRLARRDPGGYTFAVPSGGGRVLLGASPELLVSRSGTRFTSNPLAGSVPRGRDLAEDVRRAAGLLESAKDLAEHAVVVDAVRAALEPHCAELTVPERPALVQTATMWHLSTTVTGTLRDPAPSVLDLVGLLHPTPAVCGAPTGAARAAIGELEPFDRGLYSGAVGWCDASGDGAWVVTLRCAEAAPHGLRLFAGAGVVADSDPAAETAETDAKFRTFLDAVGARP